MRNFSSIGIMIVIDWYSFFFFFFFLTSALGFLPAGVRETEGFGAGILDAELVAKLLCGLYFFFLILFLAVLGLHCCFLGWLFNAVRRFLLWWLLLLLEHGL